MAETDDLRHRIERLEQLIEAIAAKVGVGEPEPPEPVQAVVAPPPVQVAAEPEPVELNAPPHRPLAETLTSRISPEPPDRVSEKASPRKPQKKRSAEDWEYLIGRRIVPIAAAIVLILGFIYLAILAITRGWISPQIQFGGELVLCAVFTGIGFLKVNEKDNFGPILVGVGLSGFYLSFAGAFFFKGLLRAETLVGAFFVISVCSHSFSWWRSSKPFLFLGLFGGIAAAMMAWKIPDIVLNMSLHGLAMLPAWILVARKKWSVEGLVIWIVTSTATLPALVESVSRGPIIGWAVLSAFWLYALIGGHTVLQARPDTDRGWRDLITIGLFSAVLIPFTNRGVVLVTNSWLGFSSILGLAALMALSSRILLQEPYKKWMSAAALAVALIVPPFTLTFFQATLIYGVVAIAVAIGSKRGKSTNLAVLSILQTALAYGAYIGWSVEAVPEHANLQLPVLGLLAVATILVAGMSAPAEKEEQYAFPAGIAVWLISVRAAVLGLVPHGVIEPVAFCWACFGFVAVSALLAAMRRWKSMAILALLVGILGAYVSGFTVLIDLDSVYYSQNLLCPFVLVSGILLTRAFLLVLPANRDRTLAISGSVLWVPFARMVWLALISVHFDGLSSGIMAIALSACAVAGYSIVRKSLTVAIIGVFVSAASAAPFLVLLTAEGKVDYWARSGELVADLVVIVATCMVSWAIYLRLPQFVERIVSACLFAIGLAVVRLAYLTFVWPPFGWQNVLTVESTTIVFGIATAILAMAKRWKLSGAVSSFCLAVSFALYPAMKVPALGLMMPPDHFITRSDNLFVLVGMFALSLLTTWAFSVSGVDKRAVLHWSAIANWPLVSGLFIHTLDLPPFRLTFDASVSVAWTAYAAGLLVIGFRFTLPVLRYWALAIFGAATLKVVAYDLAFLDPVVKVVVSIGLGTVMMAGGYLYIRSQRAKNE